MRIVNVIKSLLVPALALLLIASISSSAQAQTLPNFEPTVLEDRHFEQGLFCLDSSYCTPGVVGLPRPRGIYVDYDYDPQYQLRPKTNSLLSTANATAASRSSLRMGLRFPLLKKHHTKLVIGVSFRDENYDLPSGASDMEPFYQQLDNENLYSLGSSAYLTHFRHDSTYWLVRFKASLDGDFTGRSIGISNYLNFSLTPIYGLKRGPNLSYGFGVSMKHAYGRFSVYPVLLYYRNFNSQWGLEAALPSMARLRWRPNDRTNFYVGAQLEGTRNTLLIADSLMSGEVVALERADLRYGVRFEREIYDWLWFGVSGGLRQPLSFRVADNFAAGFPRRFDADSRANVYTSVGLFMVPPRKWMQSH